MIQRLIVVAVLLLGPVSCGEPPAPPPPPDPRNGPVDTRMDGCVLGRHCFYDYKQCFGPDLLVVIDAYADRPDRHWIKNSKECAS